MRRLARPLAVVAGAALAVGTAVVLTAPTAVGGTDVQTGGLPPGGTVTLQTNLSGGSGKITSVLKNADGMDQDAVFQTVASNTCDAVSAGPVSITQQGGTSVCYNNLGFGVDRGLEGLSFLQGFLNPNTDGTETLSIGLSPNAGVVFLGPVSLDIEAVNPQAGTDLTVTTFLKDVQVATFDVELGTRVVNSPPNYRVGFDLANAADRIAITPKLNTRFQLEGDTNNRQGSTFTLARVTDVLPCGTTEVTPDGADATLTVTTGEACAGGEAVSFTRDGNTIKVLKEPSDATFTLEITSWLPENAAYPVPATVIDYTPLDGVDDSAPMVVCAGTTGSPSLPQGFPDVIPGGIVDGWCVAGQSFELVGGDPAQMQVTETLYGQGDPAFGRLSN
jgi:hypothetical protein